MIEIREVTNKKELRKFVKFPLRLYWDCPYHIPVLINDEINEFTPSKNDAWSYCECKQFLAYDGDKIVGRIAGIINHRYNEARGLKQMRFTRFDTIDDFEVTKALFEQIKSFAKEKGCNEIIGPIGFCDLDKQGMIVEGFDRVSMYITPYNYEYYVDHIQKLGFVKDIDWVEYRIEVPTELDPKLEKMSSFVQKKMGYTVVKFKTVKEVMAKIKEGLHIMNEVYSHLYGYVALTDLQIEQFSETLKTIINVDYVCAVNNKDGELIGYGFIAPEVGKAFKKSHGHLTIPCILRLMKALNKNDTVDLYSVGVKHEYQNSGVNAIIMCEIIKACIRNGIKYAETGPELETNCQIQAQWKDIPKEQHKKRRSWILHI